jgi:hypothetical protein
MVISSIDSVGRGVGGAGESGGAPVRIGAGAGGFSRRAIVQSAARAATATSTPTVQAVRMRLGPVPIGTVGMLSCIPAGWVIWGTSFERASANSRASLNRFSRGFSRAFVTIEASAGAIRGGTRVVSSGGGAW